MNRQQTPDVILGEVYVWEDNPDFKIIYQDAIVFDESAYMIHCDIKKKFTKDLYKRIKMCYNKLQLVRNDRVHMTLVYPLEPLLTFAVHFGFNPTHILSDNSILMENE